MTQLCCIMLACQEGQEAQNGGAVYGYSLSWSTLPLEYTLPCEECIRADYTFTVRRSDGPDGGAMRNMLAMAAMLGAAAASPMWDGKSALPANTPAACHTCRPAQCRLLSALHPVGSADPTTVANNTRIPPRGRRTADCSAAQPRPTPPQPAASFARPSR